MMLLFPEMPGLIKLKQLAAVPLALLLLAGPSAQAQGLRVPGVAPSSGAATAPANRAVTPVAAAGNAQRAADFIVAVVNSDPITNNEVRQEARRLRNELTENRQPLPGDEELARRTLERLIVDKAQLQIARDTGLRVDDVAVDQAEQSVARQNQVDVAEMRRRLAASNVGLAQFREQLRDRITLARLRERDVDSRVRVSDLEVFQFLGEQTSANASASGGAVELNLAQILVSIPENASAAVLASLTAKAAAAQAQASAGVDFAALAREMSDAQDRATGGQLGLRSADRYPELFWEAVKYLPVGGVSEVIRSGAGYHVLKVLEKRNAGSAVAQTRARHILLTASSQMNEAQARDKLLDYKARVERNQADFATLARENSQDASAAQGGDLGWAGPGLFVPEFEQVMNALAPGQISAPLISRFGMHLIQVLERRTATLSAREQQDAIRNQLREKKLDEAYATWVQETRNRAYVEMREPPQLSP